MGKEKTLRVCVIIPAYNEAAVIGSVVNDAIKHVKKSKLRIDVVVINDGSSDDTSAIASTNGATVIDHILNIGVGSATAAGLSFARQNNYDIAATMDADGQHAIQDVLKGISKLHADKTDLLIGSRLIDSNGMSRTKVIGNKGLSFITYLLFGISSTDSQSGLRIYSRETLMQLKWKTSGYEFCSEMLWRAKQMDLTIDEYPIQAIYTKYSKGKGQNNWNAINIVKSLLKRRITEMFE